MDIIDTSKLKDAINFYDLALYLNEKNLSVSYSMVKMLCPFHEEKTPSFIYHIEKKFYYCHGCKKKGDLIDYVSNRLKLSFKESLDFLINFSGHNPSIQASIRTNYKKEIRSINKYEKKRKNAFTYFSEQDIKSMVDFRIDYFAKLGFTEDTLNEFEVGFDINEKRMVLPIRDDSGLMVGATGRTILGDYKDLKIPKWRHYKNSNINENLFNFYRAMKHSREQDNSIILVEGPKDVMWLHQNGFKNVIACLSNGITNIQKGILLRNFLTIYLFLDGDNGGNIGKSAIYESIKGYFNIYDIEIQKGKDPDELSKEEIQKLIDCAVKVS